MASASVRAKPRKAIGWSMPPLGFLNGVLLGFELVEFTLLFALFILQSDLRIFLNLQLLIDRGDFLGQDLNHLCCRG